MKVLTGELSAFIIKSLQNNTSNVIGKLNLMIENLDHNFESKLMLKLANFC